MGGDEHILKVLSNLRFLKIFRSFRMAIQPSKLLIAFAALAIIFLTGTLMDLKKTVIVSPTGTVLKQTQKAPASVRNKSELDIYIVSPDFLPQYIKTYYATAAKTGVFTTLLNFETLRFKNSVEALLTFDTKGLIANITDCFKAAEWALRYHFIYCLIFFVIKISVIAVAGGAICRISALQFARDEKPGLIEALRFSIKRFKNFVLAPLLPIAAIIFFGFFIFLLGLLANIPVAGELLVGISICFLILCGFIMSISAIGALVGFNLMYPAAAYDGVSFFDVMSRSFDYIFTKPWRMAFYSIVAAVYGGICYLFVRFFAFLWLAIPYLFLQLGIWRKNTQGVNKLVAIWSEPAFADLSGKAELFTSGWAESTAAFLIHIFVWLVIGLVAAFLICFYFTANTIIYALMRNAADNTPLESIYMDYPVPKEKSEPTPQPQQLSPPEQ